MHTYILFFCVLFGYISDNRASENTSKHFLFTGQRLKSDSTKLKKEFLEFKKKIYNPTEHSVPNSYITSRYALEQAFARAMQRLDVQQLKILKPKLYPHKDLHKVIFEFFLKDPQRYKKILQALCEEYPDEKEILNGIMFSILKNKIELYNVLKNYCNLSDYRNLERGNTALHRAVIAYDPRNGSNLLIMKELIHTYPWLLEIRNNAGVTPIAGMKNAIFDAAFHADIDALNFFLKLNPALIDSKDIMGNNLLHHTVSNYNKCKRKIIPVFNYLSQYKKLFIQKNLQGKSVSDILKDIIFDIVDNLDLETFKSIMPFLQSIDRLTDIKGNTILHHAIKAYEMCKDTEIQEVINCIDFIKNLYPELVDIANHKKRTPKDLAKKLLFLAIDTFDERMCKYALQTYPMLAASVDHDGNTILHRLIINYGIFGKNIRTLFNFINDLNPSLLATKNKRGKTVIDFMKLQLIHVIQKCDLISLGLFLEILSSQNVPINTIRDDKGNTVLHIAVMNQHRFKYTLIEILKDVDESLMDIENNERLSPRKMLEEINERI